LTFWRAHGWDDARITEAVFGLIGVIVGGVLTGLIAFLSEKARARRAAATSARLVREHLLDFALAAEDAIAGRVGSRPLAPDALKSVWTEERRSLASVMSYSEYVKAAGGVTEALRVPALIEGLPHSEAELSAQLPPMSAGLYALLVVADK
jgi:hypothetical protein